MRLIATWTTEQDETKDAPARLIWEDGTPATAADFARILPNTQSYPDVDANGASFSYEVTSLVSGQQIMDAINAGFLAGGKDEWDAPEFESARDLTAQAGCVWDFMGWRDTYECVRQYGKLGGVKLA